MAQLLPDGFDDLGTWAVDWAMPPKIAAGTNA